VSARLQAIAVAALFAGLVAVVAVSFLNTSALKSEIAELRAEQRSRSGITPGLEESRRKTASRIAQAENNIKVEIAQAVRRISLPPISFDQEDIDDILFTVHATNSSVSSMRNELRGLDGDIALLLSGGRPEYRNTATAASAHPNAERQSLCWHLEKDWQHYVTFVRGLEIRNPTDQIIWYLSFGNLRLIETFMAELDCRNRQDTLYFQPLAE